MTNRQFKKKIREAFSHGTPDISQKIVIDTLFCEQQEQNGAELSVVTKRKPVCFRVFGITAAACAAIAVLAISINLIINRPQSGSVDYISIDKALEAVFTSPSPFPIAGVTPTVEWELDAESATPHYDVTLTYGDSVAYQYVVDALSGEILSMEQVLQKTDPKEPITLEEAKRIVLEAAQLEENKITDCVVEMYLVADEPHYDISFRKGNGFHRYKLDPFTGEILDKYILHAMDNISEDAARDIALSEVQLTVDQISNYCIVWDDEEWPAHYDISFISQGVIYEFEIHAVSGEIRKMEKEAMVEEFISLDEATSLLYLRLNLDPTSNPPTSFKWAFEDHQGRMCYAISMEFSHDGIAEAKIDADTGEILQLTTQGNISNTAPQPPDGKLSAHQATYIALSHINLSSTDQVDNFQLREDPDSDIPHYDVSFRYKGYQYTLEIGMYDGGKILSGKKEAIYGND